MTPAHQRVLRFIEQFIGEHGYAPTYAELGKGCGYASSSNVHRIMLELERENLISIDRDRSGYGKARGINLNTEFCPYCGQVQSANMLSK